MISLETYRPDFLDSHIGYRNAVGDNPVSFDWIGSQTLRCIPMTGIHSTIPHGLVIGDRIQITVQSGNWTFSGVYDVQATKDVDNGSYVGELIVIHQIMYAGLSTAAGYWQRVPKTMPITQYAGVITGCCQPGYHHDGGNCVPDILPCQTGYVRISGICVPDTSPCPIGQHKNEFNICIADNCQTGYHWDTSVNHCVANALICPEGQEKVNSACVPKCTTGYLRDSYGICFLNTCPTGQELIGGVCTLVDKPEPQLEGFKLPSWAIWVGVALAGGLLVWSVIKNFKKAN